MLNTQSKVKADYGSVDDQKRDTFKQQFRESKQNSPFTVLVQQEPIKARQRVEKKPL